MAKRFTDTGKWDKLWIRKLSPELKLLWVYLLDKCDHAGIWEADIDLAKFQLGITIDQDEAIKVFNGRVVPLSGGEKWFIPKFIEFQYGDLNPENRVHKSVIEILERNGIQGPYKPLTRGSQGCKDKDKDKDKDMDKVGGSKGGILKSVREGWFEEDWKYYPNKDGKKQAKRYYLASVKTPEDRQRFLQSQRNYLKCYAVKMGFIKNGSTFYNNWEDWVNPTPAQMGGTKQPESHIKKGRSTIKL